MITDYYNYIDIKDKIEYLFTSKGKQGIIVKIVSFTFLEDNLWNLAFGDVHKGDFDDTVISNNHDITKIIGTVAKITYEFSAAFPSRNIHIKPVDEKRKRLYNHVFRRHYAVINNTFQIIGVKNGIEEPYSIDKVYDIFKLKRRVIQ
jgi:hydroxypyruvate isomerase